MRFAEVLGVYKIALWLQNTFKQQIIGAVVLTDYNNHTYRIDDVDFDTTPMSKFQLRAGEEISFKEYFAKVTSCSLLLYFLITENLNTVQRSM